MLGMLVGVQVIGPVYISLKGATVADGTQQSVLAALESQG